MSKLRSWWNMENGSYNKTMIAIYMILFYALVLFPLSESCGMFLYAVFFYIAVKGYKTTMQCFREYSLASARVVLRVLLPMEFLFVTLFYVFKADWYFYAIILFASLLYSCLLRYLQREEDSKRSTMMCHFGMSMGSRMF